MQADRFLELPLGVFGIAPAIGRDFLPSEDTANGDNNVVIVSRDGWVKRQKEVKDVSTTRLREGDSVLAVLAGSTTIRGRIRYPSSPSHSYVRSSLAALMTLRAPTRTANRS